MIGTVSAFLFPSTPADFPSDYPLDEAVQRLRSATVWDFEWSFTRSVMEGVVGADKVRLSRVILFYGNSSRPLFTGSFRPQGGGTVLSGSFAMSKWARASTSFALGFAIFLAALVTLGTFLGGASIWWAPFAGLGFIALLVGNLKFCHWLARKDIRWLSQTISQALTTPEKLPPPAPQEVSWLRKRFLHLAGQ